MFKNCRRLVSFFGCIISGLLLIFIISGCAVTTQEKAVDNFDDGNKISLLDTLWYGQDDSPDGGNSIVSFDAVSDETALGSAGAMKIYYKLGGLFRWPYVQVICPLIDEKKDYLDLSAFSGISFYAKSKNLSDIRVVIFLHEPGISDINNTSSLRPCEISLKTNNSFKEYKVDFTEFKTATWWLNRYPAAQKEADWSKATHLLIMEDDSLRAGAEETLWIDEIKFYRNELRVTSINPKNNTQGVSLKKDIEVDFNFPLDEQNLSSYISLKKMEPEGEAVDLSFSLSQDRKNLIASPKEELSKRSKYIFSIEQGLKSIYGSSLKNKYETAFFTKVGKGRISGAVKDKGGNPISGAEIEIYPTGESIKTDDKGSYSFKNVRLDNVYLYCQKNGYYTGFAKSKFNAQGDLSIVFSLEKTPPIDNKVNPYIFGINYNDWETDGYLLPVADKVKKAGFTLIRWGGIGKDLIEVDEAKIDEFVNYSRKIGAEPMIEVRLIRGDVEEARRAVEYCNKEKGYNIKYWLVGNEPDAYNDKGWGPYSAKDYARDYRQYYNAMKSVDSSIKIGGPELMSKYWLSADDNWVKPFLEECGDIIDLLSIHIYLFDGKQPIYQSLMGQKKVRYLVDSIRQEINDISKRQIPLIVTEYNLTWDWVAQGQGACNSIAAGLWLADFLGTLAEEDIYMATFWDIMERGTIGFLEHETYKPYPTYYTFMLYKAFRGTMLESVSNNNNLAVYGCQNKDEKVLILINKKINDFIEAEIGGMDLDSDAESQVKIESLKGIKNNYYRLPALSVTRLTLNMDNTLKDISYYSNESYNKSEGIIDSKEKTNKILIDKLSRKKSDLLAAKNVLDNFEDGDYISFKSGVWIAEDDSVNKGNSVAEIKITKTQENGILRFDYRLGEKFHNRYAICAVVFDEPIDLSDYQGISFKARGDNLPLKVKICSQSVGDYDYHGTKIIVKNEWQQYEIYFDDLQQEGWGKSVSLDLSKINKIQFETANKKSNQRGHVEIDDVVFMLEKENNEAN
jgi:hypothetical protein